MKPIYCSKGHENSAGSRFCQQCGEQLSLPSANSLAVGSVLGDRYQIIRELGHGGFGRTYLAQDRNRFNEFCVLKEFAPQVQGSYALQKAEELFEREAGVLYKLQHPQIPHFREMFRYNTNGTGYLFLVQDYVDGQNYKALLEARKRQGLKFSEPEVTQLLLQILPVLDYIHSLGVIHRDISPDNLMLRSSDGLPVLIDFGGVKQIAATIESQYNQGAIANAPTLMPTRLGKVGYAPTEQMQRGIVFPHSDLYALAVTVLVLLTGKEPQQLINQQTATWDWSKDVSLSPTLNSVLTKMLQPILGDRFQSAQEVLQALTSNQPPASYPTTQLPISAPAPQLATEATFAVSPNPAGQQYSQPQQYQQPPNSPVVIPASVQTQPNSNFLNIFGKIALVCFILAIAGGIGWLAGNVWINSNSNQRNITPSPDPTLSPSASPTVEEQQPISPQFTPEERQRKQALQQRRTQVGINSNFYVSVVNQAFWSKYPSQRGRNLGNGTDDEQWRERWDKIAADLLDKLEQANLSAEARRGMGNYNSGDRDRWKLAVNELRLSSRALYDLTDAKYLSIFSEYSANTLKLNFDNFLNQPVGQIWQAVMFDQVQALQSGTALERIIFDPGTTSKTLSSNLKQGQGKAYIAQLTQDQIMEVQLQDGGKTLLSIYSPTGKTPILADSREKSWSGTLPESGYYEIVIVSNSSKSTDYQLNLKVKNPEPEPTSPTPEPSPSESPN